MAEAECGQVSVEYVVPQDSSAGVLRVGDTCVECPEQEGVVGDGEDRGQGTACANSSVPLCSSEEFSLLCMDTWC